MKYNYSRKYLDGIAIHFTYSCQERVRRFYNNESWLFNITYGIRRPGWNRIDKKRIDDNEFLWNPFFILRIFGFEIGLGISIANYPFEKK